MVMRELSAMTWEEAARLDRSRTVAILPIGATEAHGPHLPLDTDVIIATAMARAGAARLSARGFDVIQLPALAYSPAPFAAAFDGTISISPATMDALVTDIADSLATRGVKWLALANAHFDPANVGVLRRAASMPRDCAIIFPDVTRRALAERLTAEFRSGACHAGQYETSIVLAEAADRVGASMRDLPPNMISLSTAMRDGKHSFAEAGGERAYFGDPAAATAAEGRATIDALGEILEEAVVTAIGAE